jgi:ABC-type Mn2+/Zn2+ transport system permease subunit
MFEIFELALIRRALLAALLIGFTNGFVSAFVVLHRSPLKLGALSHSIFPGIAAVVLVSGISTVGIYFGALTAAAAVGLGAVFFAKRSQVGEDTVLAVLMTGAFATGVLMLTHYEGSGGLEHWLLGNIVGMSDADLWMSYTVGALAVGVLAFFRRPILALLFEPDVATTLGVRTQILNYGLFALLILVLVTTLQAVGAILALGFIVTPAATVRQLVGTVRGLFFWSGMTGAFGAALGFVGASIFNQPIGAFMVCVMTTMYLVAVAAGALRKKAGSVHHEH